MGGSTRICQATGVWSESAPTCQGMLHIYQPCNHVYDLFLLSTVVDCGTLTNPANGLVSYSGRTTFRQIANYSCNTGYNLVGGSTRTCQATGRWSGSAPTCQRMLLKLE